MKSILLKIYFFATTLFVFATAQSQTKEFENVIQVKLQNTVPVKNNGTIVGYALFYKVDKLKKAALYRLEILDENLKSIGSNEFEGSKALELMDAVYESGHIMLAFDDPKKVDDYEKYVQVFDLKGKQTGLVSYDPDKVKKGMFGAAVAEQMSHYYNGYQNVEGKGFVCVYQSKAKTGGANVQMLDMNGKLKWEKSFEGAKGDRMDCYLTATTPNALLFLTAERNSIMARDAETFLIGLDPNNGKEMYRKPMKFKDLVWEPMLFKNDVNSGLKMISTLSHAEDKFYTAKPIGMNISALNDRTGEIILEKNFMFEGDLSKVMNMKNESKSEDGFVRIHDITLMPDGSKVFVGEFFRRTLSVLGVMGKLISHNGSGSASQITIGDMFLLKVDKNNNPVSLEKIEKNVQRIPLAADGLPIGLISRVLALDHNFGYMYTDESSDPNKKTVLARGAFEGEKYGTNSITFDSNKGYKQKRFNIEKEKNDEVYIMRGKPGHVLVMKYNEKKKKISLNLERID